MSVGIYSFTSIEERCVRLDVLYTVVFSIVVAT